MTISKYVLTATDGYSVDSTVYDTEDKARQAMEKAYNELHPACYIV